MEDSNGIGLQPLNHNKEDKISGSQLSTARSTSVGRRGSGDSVSILPSTKGTSSVLIPSNLSTNLSTSNTSTTVPSNDSVIAIDRPNNTVSNFLSEIDTKSGESFNISWEDIFKNSSYILACAMHTGMHFLITSVLMNGYCSFVYKSPEGKSVSVHSYFTRVVPCAIASALEICMANASFVFITLSFYTMIKSSTPIWVLVFAFIFGLEQPRLVLIFIITVISFGVILTVAGETKFNLTGFLLVLGAAIVSGLRWSLTQMLLQKEDGMNNPVATLYYVSPVMFILMIILSFIFEDPLLIFRTSRHFEDVNTGVETFLLMFLGGFLAFCMTIAEFALIKNTSTVTLSVAGISKEILVISLSVLIYHDVLTPINLLGLVISIAGIVGYNYYKIRKTSDDKKGRYHALPSHKNESLD
ncbi:TPT-domain-containing protein [Rhizophagus clarus]|uniref:TPT-domain-containing protein n=1 Tax=Rhizophagus clarus TaxID=94130 RepID=A0A8H3LLJ0_9GLOM|nr:TPT-domain-containing protein [Rhizophagus clarus]